MTIDWQKIDKRLTKDWQSVDKILTKYLQTIDEILTKEKLAFVNNLSIFCQHFFNILSIICQSKLTNYWQNIDIIFYAGGYRFPSRYLAWNFQEYVERTVLVLPLLGARVYSINPYGLNQSGIREVGNTKFYNDCIVVSSRQPQSRYPTWPLKSDE